MAIVFATNSAGHLGRHVAVGELARQHGAANREVDVGHRARHPVSWNIAARYRQASRIERDPVKCGDGRAPRVGTTGSRSAGVRRSWAATSASFARGNPGRHQARRIDGTPVNSEHHRETAGKNADFPPAHGAGQRSRHSQVVTPPRCARSIQWMGSVGRAAQCPSPVRCPRAWRLILRRLACRCW